MGCGLCLVHCAMVHSQYPQSVLKAYKLSVVRPVPCLILESDPTANFCITCRHCPDAPCLTACITGAIYREPDTGLVLIDEERCIACGTCVIACPFGLINCLNDRAVKCDLCYQSQAIPACVANCPNQALVYEEGGR